MINDMAGQGSYKYDECDGVHSCRLPRDRQSFLLYRYLVEHNLQVSVDFSYLVYYILIGMHNINLSNTRACAGVITPRFH